jgi:3'-phosphoadenosine 5'-phosphosulfate sulfotransferase
MKWIDRARQRLAAAKKERIKSLQLEKTMDVTEELQWDTYLRTEFNGGRIDWTKVNELMPEKDVF